MSEKDKLLAEIAGVIIAAYNGSYKPHIISNPHYKVAHDQDGYSLIGAEDSVIIADKRIDDFVEAVFSELSGATVTWDKVWTSTAVKKGLERYFGVAPIELTNASPTQDIDVNGEPMGLPEPTIWAVSGLDAPLESKGFTRFNRTNLWTITL